MVIGTEFLFVFLQLKDPDIFCLGEEVPGDMMFGLMNVVCISTL